MRQTVLVALCWLLAACSSGGKPDARPSSASPPPPAPAAPPSPCEALREEIRAAIQAAPRSCAGDDGCASYPGGPVDCGGVVGKAAAARLWELTRTFRERGCRLAVHCAPRAVRPACDSGRCVERPLR